MLFVGAVAVNALAQAALRRVSHWPWIEHPTFQLRGGHSTTDVPPPTLSHIRFLCAPIKSLLPKRIFAGCATEWNACELCDATTQHLNQGLSHAGCMWPARAFCAARDAFWKFSND